MGLETGRGMKTDSIDSRQEGHSVAHAVLLSLAATGFGQIYNKQNGKGAIVIGLAVLLVLGCIALAFSDWLSALIIFVAGALLLVTVATLDAALIARRLCRGESVGKWQCF